MADSMSSAGDVPVYARLGPEHATTLAVLFTRLQRAGVDKSFHPHPLTAQEASVRATYHGDDFYCVMLRGDTAIGYGMLRGWDEGFLVPSLGIVIDPALQGLGYGRLLMSFLHDVATQRGADRVRLKVDPKNRRAIELYRSFGYCFEEAKDGQLIGLVDLPPKSAS